MNLVRTITIILLVNLVSLCCGNSITWCEMDQGSPYDISKSVNCDRRSTLIAFPVDYATFERKVCSVVGGHFPIQLVTKQHFKNFMHGRHKSLNAPFALLKWAIINLHPNPRDLWLDFGDADGFSANLTAALHSGDHGHNHQNHNHNQEQIAREESPANNAAPVVYAFPSSQHLPHKDSTSTSSSGSTTNLAQNYALKESPSSAFPAVTGVKIVAGPLNKTLEPYLVGLRRDNKVLQVAYAGVNVSEYATALHVLRALLPLLQRGTVLHFGDMYRVTSEVAQAGDAHRTSKCSGTGELRALHVLMSEVHKEFMQQAAMGRRVGDGDGDVHTLELQLMPHTSSAVRGPVVFRVMRTGND